MRYRECVELFEDFVVYGHRLSAYSGEILELGAAHARAKSALVRSRVVDLKGRRLQSLGDCGARATGGASSTLAV